METRIFGNGNDEIYNPGKLSELVGTQESPGRGRSRRSSLEIKMDILRAVRDGALGPTQIMYKANLSWIILIGHLRELVRMETLAEQKAKSRLTYVLTDRGINVLRSYLAVVEQFEQFELDRQNYPRAHQSTSLISR